ncbi:phage tail protein [Escherichia coli]|nr:phage tail protein [Escherichia coli]
MAAKFFALLTNQGAAKLSNMAALGEKLEITSLAVGDGGGVSPTPNQAQTELVNERRRAQLNSLSVDEKNTSQIIAEQIIPESVGGWWIREIGLFDADGVLIAVANCPETYKATTEEGSGRTQVIRMMLTVSSTDAVTLKVDPSVVLATRQYVDSAVIEVKTYADNVMKKHVAEDNPHSQYPLIENALKELADAGLVGEVLKNLGLGAGSPAIGIPFFWPLAAMPNTVMDEWANMVFLKPNGASFSAAEYPKLAKVWTGLVIPDMRGEFLRIWDDGRGVDAGRGLLSAQLDALQNITGSFSAATAGAAQLSVLVNGEGGAFYPGSQTTSPPNAQATTGNDRVNTMYFDAGRVARTSTETRSRNIALNFLIRAK